MKFRVWRCLGILCLGVAAFFLVGLLACMQGTYSWDFFFHYLFDYYARLFYGFVFGLIGAAIFLSIEEKQNYAYMPE